MPFLSWSTAAVSILSIVPKFTVARRDPVSEVSSVSFFVKSGWFPLELTLALRATAFLPLLAAPCLATSPMARYFDAGLGK